MSGLVNQKTKLYRKDCMKSILKQVYIIGCMAEKRDSETPGANLGGQGGQCPPSEFFYLYVTATINSMKILFSDV